MSVLSWRNGLESLSKMQLRTESDFKEAKTTLKKLVSLSLDRNNREDVSGDTVRDTSRLLEMNRITPTSSTSTPSSTNTSPVATVMLHEIWLETLKLLRNICAELPQNQELIINHPALLPLVAELAHKFIPGRSCRIPSRRPPLTRIAMQLMGNACARVQRLGQEVVWKHTFPRLYRASLLHCTGGGCPGDGCHGDGCLADMACMLLYYCTLDQDEFRNQLCGQDRDIIYLITLTLTPDTRGGGGGAWNVLLVESLLRTLSLRTLWNCYAHNHMTPQRLVLLKLALMNSDPKYDVTANLTETAPRDHEVPPPYPLEAGFLNEDGLSFLASSLHFFSDSLLERGGALLRESHLHAPRGHGSDDLHGDGSLRGDDAPLRGSEGSPFLRLEPLDFVEVRTCHALLSCLSRCVLHTRLRSVMQRDSRLHDDLMGLLSELCTLDGSTDSSRNISKLSRNQPSEEEVDHPLYGFKRDLVQLLGNLFYQSKYAQDYCREKGGVSLILNQCGIDHRNPYITQWSVLAIRNLCEGNPANQHLIGSLKAQGVCPLDEEALRTCGGEVELGDDGRVRIKKTDVI